MADKKSGLSERQNSHALALYRIRIKDGPWKKGMGSEGAHYITAQYNPFKKEGVRCDVCVFYADKRCDIVEGDIEPNAICKLWVIPQRELAK